MRNDRDSMLFSPPLAPIRLDREHFIVVGRQAQCDLTLRHDDVSRRHAEIGFEDDRFIVRDLGSTNGTYLNGKEIGGTEPLSSGDRIEVGPQIITFCELASEGMASSPDRDETIIATRSSNAFAGDLSQIPPFAVIQVLEMGRKSGVLEINNAGISCRLWFRDGIPIHAESAKQRGFDAALSVVNADTGSFRFNPEAVTRESTIECTVTQLLLECCRQQDEKQNAND